MVGVIADVYGTDFLYPFLKKTLYRQFTVLMNVKHRFLYAMDKFLTSLLQSDGRQGQKYELSEPDKRKVITCTCVSNGKVLGIGYAKGEYSAKDAATWTAIQGLYPNRIGVPA